MSRSKSALVLASLLLFAIAGVVTHEWQETAYEAKRQQTVGTLQQIIMGLNNYRDSYGRFPPPFFRTPHGKPSVSWRGAVIDFIHAGPLWSISLSDSWESDSNAEAYLTHPEVFCFSPSQRGETRVFAITGTDTVFSIADQEIAVDRDTIVVLEVMNSNTHWLEPGDFPVGTIPVDDSPVSVLALVNKKEVAVGFYDGEAWRLSSDVPCATLRKFLRVSEATKFDRDDLLAPYRLR